MVKVTFPEIRYYDFYLGTKEQSQTAFEQVLLKLPALTYTQALDHFVDLGYPRDRVMKMRRYILKSRNGVTVSQYKFDDFKDFYIQRANGESV